MVPVGRVRPQWGMSNIFIGRYWKKNLNSIILKHRLYRQWFRREKWGYKGFFVNYFLKDTVQLISSAFVAFVAQVSDKALGPLVNFGRLCFKSGEKDFILAHIKSI